MRYVYRACGYETGRCDMSRVEDIDLGWKNICKELKHELDGVVIRVGVQSSAKAAKRTVKGKDAQRTTTTTALDRRFKKQMKMTDQPLAVIAAVHEFGLGHVPQRSFLRGAYDDNKELIDTMVDRIATNSLRKDLSIQNALHQLGQVMEGKVKEKIVNGPFVPNSNETIKRKGSSRPLIDTGHLRQSIRYVIEKGGSDNE